MSVPQLRRTERVFYHLSHTDLDGYGAQYLIKEAGILARYYNADYREIATVLESIVREIKQNERPAFLLITDLNLTDEQADWLDKQARNLGDKLELLLLDHHATGQSAADKHDWYYLDTQLCATRLTYFACANLIPEPRRALMDNRSALVDVGDRWLKSHPDFVRGVFMVGLVMEEDNLAPPLIELKRAYRFHVMDGAFAFLETGATLEALELELFNIRKRFLKDRVKKDVYNDEELPLKDKMHRLSAELLSDKDVPIMNIDGHRAGVFFNWPHDVYRGVVMQWMEVENKMDMALGVRGNGRMSLRSNPGTDVGQIAAKYFSGGGHPGASGGVLKDNRIRDARHAMKVIKDMVAKHNVN